MLVVGSAVPFDGRPFVEDLKYKTHCHIIKSQIQKNNFISKYMYTSFFLTTVEAKIFIEVLILFFSSAVYMYINEIKSMANF